MPHGFLASYFALAMMWALVGFARAADTAAPDQRDVKVLDALLLHLLADSEFNMGVGHSRRGQIVLHARTPEKTGMLGPDQMHSDIGSHTMPLDVERDLRQRNSSPDPKPDTYASVTAFFTNSTFSSGILVSDLSEVWKARSSAPGFRESFPKARGWLVAYLPGYSKNGEYAVVRGNAGPSPHGASVTALLKRSGDKWVIKWCEIAFYV
jgi:hypothetical protein